MFLWMGFLNHSRGILFELSCLACNSGSLDVDEYDLVDPVDILTPLGKSGFWDGVVSA